MTQNQKRKQSSIRLPNRTPRTEIHKLITEACEANGCPELASQIKVKWNKRYTNCMGRAEYHTKIVSFSIPLWPRASQQERENTIVHEACHIINFYKHGHIVLGKPHGKLWKTCMRKVGYKAERCHNVDRTGLRRKTKKYAYSCNCMTHMISSIKHGKMQRGCTYFCRKCGSKLMQEKYRATKIGPMVAFSF